MCFSNTPHQVCNRPIPELHLRGSKFTYGPSCRVAIQDHIITNRLYPGYESRNFNNLLTAMYLHKCGPETVDLLRAKIKKCISERLREMVQGGLIVAEFREGQLEFTWREDADAFLGCPGWNRDWSVDKGRELAGMNPSTVKPNAKPSVKPTGKGAGSHETRAVDNGPKAIERGGLGYDHYHGTGLESAQTVTPRGFYGGNQIVANAGGSIHVHLLENDSKTKPKGGTPPEEFDDKMDIDSEPEVTTKDMNVKSGAEVDWDEGASTCLWPADEPEPEVVSKTTGVAREGRRVGPRSHFNDGMSEVSLASDEGSVIPSDSISSVHLHRRRTRPNLNIPPPIPEEPAHHANEPPNIGIFPKPSAIDMAAVRAELEAASTEELLEAYDEAADMAIYLANVWKRVQLDRRNYDLVDRVARMRDERCWVAGFIRRVVSQRLEMRFEEEGWWLFMVL